GGVNLISASTMYIFVAILAVIFIYHTWQTWAINVEHLRAGVPELEKYSFRQVGILNIAYFATFGSELAVVSMLPLYFLQTFEGLNPVTAGLLASGFAFMNLVSRPMGGWFSDRYGRRRSLLIMISGLAVGYFMMGLIDSHWWILIAVLVTMACSFFVQAGEGAVFAMIPLIKRSMTGQIAGMAGAYGNVGAVVYLTVLSFVSYSTFFYVIAASALVGLVAVYFMENPRGHIAEVMPDGTVHTIEVGHK
ncbi:MFS transporter, partial [Aliidiomarina sp.]|uniref:MFS transporter n=1 Tax=Aliidiomarina sp. TaxID=1872439 RepID=UPI003A4D355D